MPPSNPDAAEAKPVRRSAMTSPTSDARVDIRRVYIVDDDASVRRSTSFLLQTSDFYPRPFLSGIDFLDSLTELQPGVVLLDVRMPQLDGIALLERLPAHARSSFPVVVMTGHGDIQTAVQAMKNGARDFLEKPFTDSILFEVLDRAFVDLQLARVEETYKRCCVAKITDLSPRELEVLKALAKGHPNKVVAHHVGLSVRTVEMHRSNLMDRLGVRTLPEAIRIAHGAGIEL